RVAPIFSTLTGASATARTAKTTSRINRRLISWPHRVREGTVAWPSLFPHVARSLPAWRSSGEQVLPRSVSTPLLHALRESAGEESRSRAQRRALRLWVPALVPLVHRF